MKRKVSIQIYLSKWEEEDDDDGDEGENESRM